MLFIFIITLWALAKLAVGGASLVNSIAAIILIVLALYVILSVIPVWVPASAGINSGGDPIVKKS